MVSIELIQGDITQLKIDAIAVVVLMVPFIVLPVADCLRNAETLEAAKPERQN
jgi:hypothetical protein